MKKDNLSDRNNGRNDTDIENNERDIPITSLDEINEVPETNGQPEESMNASLEKERNDLKEKVLRISAELENMRRRVLKEKNELIEYANQNLFLKLLPLMDDFENAIKAGKASEDSQSLLQGIEMIYNKAVKIFEDAGVKKLDIQAGDPFNVDYHEAILKMPSDKVDEDSIIDVAENGYMIYDKVLRHAKVITSSGKSV